MNMELDLFDTLKEEIENCVCEYVVNHSNTIFKKYPIFSFELLRINEEIILKCDFIPTKKQLEDGKNVFSINQHYHLFSAVIKDIKNFILKWFGFNVRISSDFFYVDCKPYYDYESTYTLGF